MCVCIFYKVTFVLIHVDGDCFDRIAVCTQNSSKSK